MSVPGAKGAEELAECLQKTLFEVHQLETTIANFKETGQLLVFERVNGLVKELANMQSTSEACDIEVPVDVIRFIDEGRNPDQFTRDFLNGCIQRNQGTRGRIEAFKAFRGHLRDELDEVFPEEMEAYRELRMASLMATRAATQGVTPPAKANGDVVRTNEEPMDGHPGPLGSSLGTMDVASGSQRLASGGTQTEQRNGREGHAGGGPSTRLPEREVGRSG